MSDIESKVEVTGPVARTIKVSVAAAAVAAELDRSYANLKRKAQVKGFRKGKVPRPILEQHYGEEVLRDVISDLIEKACGEAVRENELNIVAPPRLLDHKYEAGQALEFAAGVELRPEFTLGQYRNLEAVRRVVRVEEQHVDKALVSLRERSAVLETVEDRVNVAPGDIVVFDMYGFHQDEAVKGASGQGIQLEVGSGRFPEDFEKQLVGVTRSIKTPINVSFAEDYANEEMAGKTIRFDVTVSEIKKKVLPDLDDDFVQELGIEGCDDLEQLRARVRQDLEARARSDADRELRQSLLEQISESHDFDLPESVVSSTVHDYVHEMGLEQAPEDKREEILKALEERARKQVKVGFVLDEIARKEEFEASREELEMRIRREMAAAGDQAEKVRQYYSQPSAIADLRTSILREKAVAKVMEEASVRDEEIDESEVAAR